MVLHRPIKIYPLPVEMLTFLKRYPYQSINMKGLHKRIYMNITYLHTQKHINLQ